MSWYTNLKIRVKLLIGFIFLTCILVFIGVFGITQTKTLANSGVYVFRHNTKPLGCLIFMTRDYLTMRIHLRNLRNANTKEAIKYQLDELYKANKNVEAQSKIYEEGMDTQREKNMYTTFLAQMKRYLLNLDTLIVVRNANDEAGIILRIDSAAAIGIDVATVLEEMTNYNISHAAQTSDKNAETANSIVVIMTIVIIMGAVISIMLAFYISKMISTPLKVMHGKTQYMAKTGDLTTKIEVNLKDEIGSVNEALMMMISNFRGLIKAVISNIENINKESEGLAGISEMASTTSVELQAQTQTASETIHDIAKNIVSATVLTKKSEDRANEASEVMNRLGQSSLEIGNIVKSITDIAEQTNLLALNATIEAARAGEMGKGFAVVANEVKDLAKESAKATEDITKKIKTIQDDTKNAIEVIQEIIENAIKINDVTTTIASAVEERSHTGRDVGRAIEGVNSIVDVISGMVEAVNNYTQQANDIKTTSGSLKTLAIELDKQIKESFKV